jgi:hypothetical protein
MALKAPLQFLILLVASSWSRRQGEAIEYLRAENRVLRARVGVKRLRFTDAERRLLAEKGRRLGRALLAEIASLATPEMILRWYRQQVAAKYDGTAVRRGPGRRRSPSDTVEQVVAMARDNPSWGTTIVEHNGSRTCAASRGSREGAESRHQRRGQCGSTLISGCPPVAVRNPYLMAPRSGFRPPPRGAPR